MSKEKRLKLIKKIETKRASRVICYVTGDRQGFETRIAKDIYHMLYQHLLYMKNVTKIDLLIYSRGGDTLAAFGLVNHIREFCDRFCTLVPYIAHSAATLVALGADEIVMGRLGQLSPIDPSVNSPYNPTIPGPQVPPKFLPVSVEEVVSFINLAKKEVKVPETDHKEILNILGSKVHPLALGKVYRSREQIGMLASKLLEIHNKKGDKKANDIIKKTVETLTRKLGSHDYLITRTEAKKKLKLRVVYPDEKLEALMWELLSMYLEELETTQTFSPDGFLGADPQKTGVFKRAYIESTKKTDVFVTEKIITRITLQPPAVPFPQPGFQDHVIFEGWREE